MDATGTCPSCGAIVRLPANGRSGHCTRCTNVVIHDNGKLVDLNGNQSPIRAANPVTELFTELVPPSRERAIAAGACARMHEAIAQLRAAGAFSAPCEDELQRRAFELAENIAANMRNHKA